MKPYLNISIALIIVMASTFPTIAQQTSPLETGQYQLQDFRKKLKDVMAVSRRLDNSNNPAIRSDQMVNFLVEGNFLTTNEIINVEWLEGGRHIKEQIPANTLGAILQKKKAQNASSAYKMRVLAVDIFQLTNVGKVASRNYAEGISWRHAVGDDGCLELLNKTPVKVPLRTDTERLNLSNKVGKTFLTNLTVEMRESSPFASADASRTRGGDTDSKVIHNVQKGETLYSIARHHQMTVKMLKDQNQLTDNVIYPGQVLTVRGVSLSSESTRRISPNSGTSSPSPLVTSSDSHYIVLQGDDMFSVANKFNITILQLMDLNPNTTFPLEAGNQVKVKP